MMIAIGISHKDYDQTRMLLEWMRDVQDGYPNHFALIVASAKLDMTQVKDLVDLAKSCKFSGVQATKLETEEEGWPRGPNSMFRRAAGWVKHNSRTPFLWVEPDLIPMGPKWLDTIEAEYLYAGRPFMGTIYDVPFRHLNGCAVYPANISHYNPYMLNGTSLPWDLVRPEYTLRYAHITPLINRQLADTQTNTPMTFPSDASLVSIPQHTKLFHGCKDGTLILRLRERKNRYVPVAQPFTEVATKTIKRTVRALLRGGSSYYHSGNLGDVIYALYSIKLHGGGDLFIGPKQNHTSPCSMPIDSKQFEILLPLLKAQSYLRKVEFRGDYPDKEFQYDLNQFRDNWVNWNIRVDTGIHNLAKMHCFTLGVSHSFDEDCPWLEVGEPIYVNRIIVHRSRRYNDPTFPWKELTQRYSNQMLFLGTEDEWIKFQHDFGCKVSFWRSTDFLDMAKVIAGGKCFVGNQSMPCAIALAVGQRVYQESWVEKSPDCLFNRDTFMNQRTGSVKQFATWV